MLDTKLIIVEGMPGFGKSTLAQLIGLQLIRNDVQAEWYLEMGVTHPVDFNYQSYLTASENLELMKSFPKQQQLLQREGRQAGDYVIYNYLRLRRQYPQAVDQKLVAALEKYDITEAEPQLFIQQSLSRWRAFVKRAQQSDGVTILESSLLQVSLIELLAKDADASTIESYVETVSDLLAPLEVCLIYLYSDNVSLAMRQVLHERGAGFSDYVIKFVEQSNFGKARDLQGIDGVVTYFETYCKIVRRLLKRLSISKLAIENSQKDWTNYEDQVLAFLGVRRRGGQIAPQELRNSCVGRYHNSKLNRSWQVKDEGGELYLYFNDTYKDKLIFKQNNTFYISADCLEVTFLGQEIIIAGQESAAAFGVLGTRFAKIDS